MGEQVLSVRTRKASRVEAYAEGRWLVLDGRQSTSRVEVVPGIWQRGLAVARGGTFSPNRRSTAESVEILNSVCSYPGWRSPNVVGRSLRRLDRLRVQDNDSLVAGSQPFAFGFGPRRLGLRADFLRCSSMRAWITECGTERTFLIAPSNRWNASAPSIISAT